MSKGKEILFSSTIEDEYINRRGTSDRAVKADMVPNGNLTYGNDDVDAEDEWLLYELRVYWMSKV